MIQDAKPNAAHRALARLAERKANFLTLTMNVDDLSERAEHPVYQLHHLHGSIFDVKCSICGLLLSGDEAEHAITPLLRHDFSSPLKQEDIPCCPMVGCGGLLRPGIVWFTESIPRPLMKSIHDWINDPQNDMATIDTMLVIGTSALVYSATAYIEAARRKGARVVVVDIVKEDPSLLGLEEQDWYFEGDAAEMVSKLLEPVIGNVS
jgi:NAD-dependent deacetylase sirtuin 5